MTYHSICYHVPIKHKKARLGNRWALNPNKIPFSTVTQAIDRIRNIPDWQTRMCELMFTTPKKLRRIIKGDITKPEIVSEFINRAKELANAQESDSKISD